MLLFLPLLAARLAERVVPDAVHKVEFNATPTRMNELLASVFKLETPVLRHRPLPVGTSAYCVARKGAREHG